MEVDRMADGKLYAVTGVSGFSGNHIARMLLARGDEVINFTGHPQRKHDLEDRVKSYPFSFDSPDELTKNLQGVDVLFNTYWVRFDHGDKTFERAVRNSGILIKAAEDAGVRRIVHISITNPSLDSPLPYYRGKAQVEDAIRSSKLTYAILRPNVLFGDQGILINNIAWFLRHLPVFGVPGSGEYEMQPIYVEDLAGLAAKNADSDENVVFDAVGPEIYQFDDLLEMIKAEVQSKALIVHMPPFMALLATNSIGKMVNDVILTPDEVKGLMANLLVSSNEPTGKTRISEWVHENRQWLGTTYFSELKKHYK